MFQHWTKSGRGALGGRNDFAFIEDIAAVALGAIAAMSLGSPAIGQTPVRGGSITASVLELPQTLDPLLGNSVSIDLLTLDLIYDTLIVWDDAGEYAPGLAESWTFSDDGKTLTLEPRSGIQFHDSTPFDAEAVAFNLRRVISEEVNSPYRPNVSVIDSIGGGRRYGRDRSSSPSGAIIGALTGQPGMMASAAIELAEDFDAIRWNGAVHLQSGPRAETLR